ncbi:MAG: type IV pilus twitching motility protein PilT [Planctomycetes bacterium]|nr:type IV pilus twitching motility protein PilT [Planctomycetota bacterium]
MNLAELLLFTKEAGGSDLVVAAGAPAAIRVRGEMRRVSGGDGREAPPLGAEQVRALIYGLLTEEQRKRLELDHELDLGMAIGADARFRANVFFQEHGLGAVFRVVPTVVPAADALGLPAIVRRIAELKRGLVLVTGPTGSGKSTTLAAIVDLINQTRRAHILTIEDPIEFLHAPKLSIINQRAVGPHTRSFAAALRSALREAPDVIMVGELRDHETVSLALKAAETGHLVLGTLHTSSAPKTVERILGVFPADEQAQARTSLAESLQAVIAQLLLPRRGGGRVAAFEVMVATLAVRAMIREGKTHELLSAIQTGAQHGMQSLEQALSRLVVEGKVDKDVSTTELDAIGLAREGGARGQPAPNGVAAGRPGEARSPRYRYT